MSLSFLLTNCQRVAANNDLLIDYVCCSCFVLITYTFPLPLAADEGKKEEGESLMGFVSITRTDVFLLHVSVVI